MKIKNIIYRIVYSIFYMIYEKKYHKDIEGHNLSYIFKDNHSKNLCVVFSAFPKPGNMPGYDLIKSLWRRKCDCSFLFIKDNFINIPSGGSYYLGKDGNYFGIEFISSFINQFKKDNGFTKCISTGFSKGGTCAVIFGIKLQFDFIIPGACQYYIGTYLSQRDTKVLTELTGEDPVQEESIRELDMLTKEIITESSHTKHKPIIYFHYSDQEHTYHEHVVFLLHDLIENGFQVNTNIGCYNDHMKGGHYYRDYFLQILEEILSNNS